MTWPLKRNWSLKRRGWKSKLGLLRNSICPIPGPLHLLKIFSRHIDSYFCFFDKTHVYTKVHFFYSTLWIRCFAFWAVQIHFQGCYFNSPSFYHVQFHDHNWAFSPVTRQKRSWATYRFSRKNTSSCIAGFFCPLSKKLSVEKTQIKPGWKKNSVNFAFKTQSTTGLSLLQNWKKTPYRIKTDIFCLKTSHFFLQNSIHRRPPAFTGLQKSGQKNSLNCKE